MRQLVQNLKNGTVEFLLVPDPSPPRGYISIRVRKSLISPGTERMLLEFGKANWVEKALKQPEAVRKVPVKY
ncbi:MAG: hypothetical protein RMJ39_09725 [Deltaproteobacteria bacterium]|nr:hypothetical protein [Deltaproteobacteria bacterium]